MKALLISLVCLVTAAILPAQNQNVSSGFLFDGEPFLAVNPNNGNHLVVAWMGFSGFNPIFIKTRASFDGGANWSPTVNIPHVDPVYGSADPSLGFDSQGNVLLAYIDFSFQKDSGAVFVRRSTDGGLSWGSPAFVMGLHDDPDKSGIDRPWMVVDRSGGPHDGTVYVTSMSAGSNDPSVIPPYHPYLTRSTDGGLSFQPFRRLDTTNYEAGSIITTPMPSPAIANDGTFYAAYPAYVPSTNLFPRAVLVHSTDGGATLNYSERIPTIPGFTDDDAKKAALLRVNPANSDHLVAVSLSTLHGDADVFLQESFDAGVNWSSPVRINDDPIGNNRMQDMLWADFDEDGDLVVTWRDRRNSSDSTYATASEIFGAVRLKTKMAFEPNFSFSDGLVAYDSILTSSGNDFLCVQLHNDTLSAAWGDPRNGALNIWFQRRDLAGVVLSAGLIADEKVPAVRIFPNPSTDWMRIEGEGIRRVEVVDVEGKRVAGKEFSTLGNVCELKTESWARGFYFVRVETENGTVTRKVQRIAD